MSSATSPAPRTVALLLAAGTGERLGLSVPKAFAPLAGGVLLERSLVAVRCAPGIEGVILVVPADRLSEAAAIAAGATPGAPVLDVVAGGATRQESVERGLEAVGPSALVVVCHDAARPFAPPELFARVIAALSDGEAAQGAVPVIPVPDTVKRVSGGVVTDTVPRDELALAQTPQAFAAEALRDAHARAAARGLAATDDAGLLEASGYRLVAVAGTPGNFKITSPEDLRRAELLIAAEGPLP
jgi:2-C-methyl-D-erythritol 4-phosphate cytidylyltransferase/2-C-methyl-D-erythritol 2,4-cyclodiphosphate synthase